MTSTEGTFAFLLIVILFSILFNQLSFINKEIQLFYNMKKKRKLAVNIYCVLRGFNSKSNTTLYNTDLDF